MSTQQTADGSHTAPDMGAGVSPDASYDPRTGEARGHVWPTPASEVEETLASAEAAAPVLARTSPAERAAWLRALAGALEAPGAAPGLVALADRKTALGESRLTGELARTAAQLRFYADVAEEGSWLRATVDHPTATAPWLGRVQHPLGPVAVFGASNFPFAFGALGNDTASALAAGCPVVAKAHPAHPRLSMERGRLAVGALPAAGAPEAFSGSSPLPAGSSMVTSEHTAAVGFTGSQPGGWRSGGWPTSVSRHPHLCRNGDGQPPGGHARGCDAGYRHRPWLRLVVHAGHGSILHEARIAARSRWLRSAGGVRPALLAAAPRGWFLTQAIGRSALAGVWTGGWRRAPSWWLAASACRRDGRPPHCPCPDGAGARRAAAE